MAKWQEAPLVDAAPQSSAKGWRSAPLVEQETQPVQNSVALQQQSAPQYPHDKSGKPFRPDLQWDMSSYAVPVARDEGRIVAAWPDGNASFMDVVNPTPEHFKGLADFVKSKNPETSAGEAFGRNAANVPAFGLIDEFEGLTAAGNTDTAKEIKGAGQQLANKLPAGTANQNRLSQMMRDIIGYSAGGAGNTVDAVAGIGKYWGGDKDAEKRYNDRVAESRAYDDKLWEEHPDASFAGTVAGSLPMMATGIGGSARAASTGGWLQGLKHGATGSALLGGAYGIGDGRGLGDTLQKGAIGAGLGGLSGYVLPRIPGALNRLIGLGRGSGKSGLSKPAEKLLRKALQEDGLNANVAKAQFDKLGPNAMLMDIGPNLQATAGALANSPGRGQSILKTAIGGRDAGASERITSGIDRILGRAKTPNAIEEGLRAQQRTLGPLYDEAIKGAKAVDTRPIANSLQSDVASLRGEAQTAAARLRRMLNAHGEKQLDTNPATLFQTRQAVDGILATEQNPQVKRLLTGARGQIDDKLAESAPRLKAVDAKYRELARQRDGVDYGRSLLDGGKKAVTPEDFQRRMVSSVEPQGLMIGPSGEMAAIRDGLRADIDRRLGTTMNDRLALRDAIKGKGDWNRLKMEGAYGSEKVNKLSNLLDSEAAFSNTSNSVTQNSATAARQAAQAGLEGKPGDAKLGFITGGVKGTLRAKGLDTLEKAFGGISAISKEKRNELIARALTGDVQSSINLISHLQKTKQITTPQINKIMPVLMAIGGAQGSRTGN